VYIKDEGELNKSYFFSVVKQHGYCGTLQSLAESCGRQETVDMTTIILPKVVQMQCDSSAKKLRIS